MNAGLAITQRVLASALFRNSRRVGVFVSCRRLREVDTAPLLAKLLGQGTRQDVSVVFLWRLSRRSNSFEAAVLRSAGRHSSTGHAPPSNRCVCSRRCSSKVYQQVLTAGVSDSLADLSPNRMGILEPSAETQAGVAREDGAFTSCCAVHDER
jgi:hypothetical protein